MTGFTDFSLRSASFEMTGIGFLDTLLVQLNTDECPIYACHAREGGYPGLLSGFPPELVPEGFRRGACGNDVLG
jgi:hypothetical protein